MADHFLLGYMVDDEVPRFVLLWLRTQAGARCDRHSEGPPERAALTQRFEQRRQGRSWRPGSGAASLPQCEQ